MKCEAVIFDYSGVLVQMDYRIARTFFRERSPLPVSELTRRWEAWCSEHSDDSLSAATLWRDYWASLGHEFSVSAPTLQEIYAFDYMGMFRAWPDAAPALGEARRLGLRTGVLSNSALPKIESPSAPLVLANLVDVIRVPCRGNAMKPSREAYLEMAELLGTMPQRCLFFDNEPSFVDAARDAGMRGYLVDRGPDSPAAPGVVRDLSQLATLVERVSGET